MLRSRIAAAARLIMPAALLAIASATPASAYEISGPAWRPATRITMQLALGTTGVVLQDGAGTWNNSAAAALQIWNEQLQLVQFSGVQTSATTGTDGDNVNTAFFSRTIYGQSFGSNTLAVTLTRRDANFDAAEADVIFNSSQPFNSYRGPLQSSASGAVYDFRRVAIHEFGHVLGLDHPDAYGQAVQAIMNSVISDLDTLAADDIAGVMRMYGQTIVASSDSGTIGVPFESQLTSNYPTSYTASGLPPGLTLDSTAGKLSGTPTSAGTFDVTFTVVGPFKPATATLRFTIKPPAITSSVSPGAAGAGNFYRYQITADNNPTSFAAVGLPPGMTLDTTTGVISGVATKVGYFKVEITAYGAVGPATAVVTIVVNRPKVTSNIDMKIQVGAAVRYQIGVSCPAVSFSASSLPSGLTLDPKTGVISGVATLSGITPIVLYANTAYGPATQGLLYLTVQPAYEHLLDASGTAVVAMVADKAKGRLYVGFYNDEVVAYDTETLQVTHRIALNFPPEYLSLSADGTKLWVTDANYHLSTINPENFAVDEGPQCFGCAEIGESAAGRVYVARAGGISELNLATGATTAVIQPADATYGARFQLSPDRKTLYMLSGGWTATLARYDITGSVPSLIESVAQAGMPSSLTVSHDGALVVASTIPYYGEQPQIRMPVRSTSALGEIRGALNAPRPNTNTGSPVVFSMDDAEIFQASATGAYIDVFDGKTFALLRQIPQASFAVPRFMAIDRNDSYLFDYAPPMPLLYHPLKQPPTPPAPAHSLLNVSTRLVGGTGDNSLIAGFIVTGTAPKKVLLRGLGPSLNLDRKMADPQIEVHDGSGKLIASNDNWNYSRAVILATGVPPDNERDAAIVATLHPGSYTAVLTGVGNTSGVAVVEMYDLDTAHSRIANISTRGRVGVGNSVMIGGFILGGDQTSNVLLRAIGPSLRKSGITGALGDTTLELRDRNGALVAQNDDWRSDQEQVIAATGAAPTDNREAAIVAPLSPGAYTAVVRGKNNTTGIGLVEVYNLTP